MEVMMEQLKADLNQTNNLSHSSEVVKGEPLGDGKGAFFGEGDEEEFEEFVKMEDHGWKGFINKVRNLGKNKDDTNEE